MLLLPGEVCVERLKRGNHGHTLKAVLNAQKAAEAIVPGENTREGPNQHKPE